MNEPDPIRAWLDDPWRAIRRVAWTLGSGVAVLAILLIVARNLAPADGGLQGLWERLRGVPAASGLLLVGLGLLVSGFRWRELMPLGTWPSGVGLAAIQCAGALLTYATPGPVGEVGAAWLARRWYAVPLAAGLAASVAARVISIVTAGFLALGAWIVFDLPVRGSLQAPIGLVAVGLGLGGVAGVAVAARPEATHRLISWALGPFRGEHRVGRAIAAFDRAVAAGVAAIGAVARRGALAWVRASGWALTGHLAIAGAMAMAAWGVGAHPHLPGILFTYAAVTAGTVLIYAAPGSQLATDGASVGLLVVAAGLSVPDAIAATLLLRVQTLVVLSVGGLGALRLDRAKAHPDPSG